MHYFLPLGDKCTWLRLSIVVMETKNTRIENLTKSLQVFGVGTPVIRACIPHEYSPLSDMPVLKFLRVSLIFLDGNNVSSNPSSNLRARQQLRVSL